MPNAASTLLRLATHSSIHGVPAGEGSRDYLLSACVEGDAALPPLPHRHPLAAANAVLGCALPDRAELGARRPHQRLRQRMEAECSCPDRTRGWCKHVAALCLALVEFCESKPTQMLDGLGISLLDIEAEERKAAARLLGKRVGEEWPFSPSTSSKRISLSRTDGLPSSSEKHPILLE